MISYISFGLPFLLAAHVVAAQHDRAAWLKQHSVPLRTISADSTDFTDLEPLIPVLAGVRVVQLSELTHGDGNGSAARVRLIRFLHERLGFNVVVWEAGFYEVERLNGLLASDQPLGNVPGSALWWFWSGSAQIEPLFAYARASWQTDRPLRMAGFDLQFTGGIRSLLPRLHDIPHWFRQAGRPLRSTLGNAFDSAWVRVERIGESELAAAHEVVFVNAAAVSEHFQRHAAAMRATHGNVGAARIERVLRNLVEYRQMLRDRDRSWAGGEDGFRAFLASYNHRERVNADNLLWLVTQAYPREKLVVWSHNVHAAHTRFGGHYDSIVKYDAPNSLESTGRLLRERLGDQMYSIGTVAYEGHWAFPGEPAQQLQPSPANALVKLLHDAGLSYALVDLRPARVPGHWLQLPIPGTLSGQVPDRWYPIVWPAVFDGVLFIDRMTPTERARR